MRQNSSNYGFLYQLCTFVSKHPCLYCRYSDHVATQGTHSHSSNGSTYADSAPAEDNNWQNDFAFLILSGNTTAQTRLPIILLTWLSTVTQYVVLGADGKNQRICTAACIDDLSSVSA